MSRHFEYAVEVSQPPERVFQLLLDPETWRGSRVYGQIRWVEGEAWAVDSVREVETLVPFRARHRQRVLEVRANQIIGVVSHGMGYTNHTQIVLTPMTGGGTSVQYLIDIEGRLPLFGYVIEEFVSRFMNAYLPELRRVCAEKETSTHA